MSVTLTLGSGLLLPDQEGIGWEASSWYWHASDCGDHKIELLDHKHIRHHIYVHRNCTELNRGGRGGSPQSSL
ncbi:hypothetical protein J6590_074973 [Homalodisca vitripennis]|nr:hypothetical protein J6590_074973 [Homalodisca vitripennis]